MAPGKSGKTSRISEYTRKPQESNMRKEFSSVAERLEPNGAPAHSYTAKIPNMRTDIELQLLSADAGSACLRQARMYRDSTSECAIRGSGINPITSLDC